MNIKVRNLSPISQASYSDLASRITTAQFNSCNVIDRQTDKQTNKGVTGMRARNLKVKC